MIPNMIEALSATTRASLETLKARLLPFEVKAETLAFLYGGKVVASAAAESLAEDQADSLNELITFRYDAYEFFQNNHWLEVLPADEPLKQWFEQNLPKT